MLLEGMHLPLTTPFFPDGRLNLRKMEGNVAHYSLTPAAGMVVLGANGEANLLTGEERVAVLRAAIAAAAATKVMLAGVSCDGLAATLLQVEGAASLGYDAVVVAAPSFARIAAVERGVYLRAVADRSPLPLVLSGAIEEELLCELAFHPQVIGTIRDFAGAADMERLLQRTAGVQRTVTVTSVFAAVTGRMRSSQASPPDAGMISAASLTGGGAVAAPPARPAVKTRAKQVGFQLLAGTTEAMLPALLAGAVGAVPPFAVAAPQACYEVLAAWKDGDTPLAEEKQLRLGHAARLVETDLGVPALKYASDLNGYFGGQPRLPLLPLLGEQKARVERLMQPLQS